MLSRQEYEEMKRRAAEEGLRGKFNPANLFQTDPEQLHTLHDVDWNKEPDPNSFVHYKDVLSTVRAQGNYASPNTRTAVKSFFTGAAPAPAMFLKDPNGPVRVNAETDMREFVPENLIKRGWSEEDILALAMKASQLRKNMTEKGKVSSMKQTYVNPAFEKGENYSIHPLNRNQLIVGNGQRIPTFDDFKTGTVKRLIGDGLNGTVMRWLLMHGYLGNRRLDKSGSAENEVTSAWYKGGYVK
jgi:hypothetical protein